VRFFLAVARTGSLSGAARALHVGHVTVGRRIALLERRLGVTLLNRTPDGFAPRQPEKRSCVIARQWKIPHSTSSASLQDETHW
jgi:hypothetical protein